MKLAYFLVLAPLALIARVAGLSPELVFLLSFLGVIPLAGLVGDAAETLAIHAGPKVGSLLNATFGSITELILYVALLRAGQVDIAKASIAGSVLLSLLPAVGISQVAGGLRHGIQRFDQRYAGMTTAMMVLAVIGLLLPTLLGIGLQLQRGQAVNTNLQDRSLELLSIAVAVVLLALYGLSLLFELGKGGQQERDERVSLGEAEVGDAKPRWSMPYCLALLAGATLGVAALSELLSDTVEPFGETLGLNALFLGVVLLPLAVGIPDVMVAGRMAWRNHFNFSLAICTNAAMQTALLIGPILILLAPLIGVEMTFYFTLFEVVALGLAVFAIIMIAGDGRSNWLEGAQLLALYAILAAWFLLYEPTTPAMGR